jgi:hypothetical protein
MQNATTAGREELIAVTSDEILDLFEEIRSLPEPDDAGWAIAEGMAVPDPIDPPRRRPLEVGDSVLVAGRTGAWAQKATVVEVVAYAASVRFADGRVQATSLRNLTLVERS